MHMYIHAHETSNATVQHGKNLTKMRQDFKSSGISQESYWYSNSSAWYDRGNG